MRRSASVFLPLLLATALTGGCDDAASTGALDPDPKLFSVPIAGTMNLDWFMTNYPDREAGSGVGDYRCGPKSYDGHRGTDMVLPSFAAMDDGVDVVAAAPGTVIEIIDGEFDRNKEWSDTTTWNVVWVNHGDHAGHAYTAYYGHLKNGSVAVEPGQDVERGTVLGQVGSSGRSDMPHLHFEVRRFQVGGGEAEVMDPWEGPCGHASLWLDQVEYQDRFRIILAGVTTDSMSLDRAKDPPDPAAEVVAGGARYVAAWIHLHNARPDGTTVWRWYRPDGTLFSQATYDHDTFYSMSWWWAWIAMSALDEAGTWWVEVESHGEPVGAMTFQVAPDPGAAAVVLPDGKTGVGGGGLRP